MWKQGWGCSVVVGSTPSAHLTMEHSDVQPASRTTTTADRGIDTKTAGSAVVGLTTSTEDGNRAAHT